MVRPAAGGERRGFAGRLHGLKPPNDTKNFGTSTSLVADRETADLQRVLVQFDLSAIPANATINSATLKMQATQLGGALTKALATRAGANPHGASGRR